MSQPETSNSETAAGESGRQDGDGRELPPAAQRALAEAAARRAEQEAAEAAREVEVGGQRGPDPIRYGDWEKDGIVSDF